jgi:hypothetical protein
MKWATRLYTLLSRLYPPDYYDEFGEEMTAVFTQALADTQRHSRTAMLIWYGHEFASLLAALIRERWCSWRREETVMKTSNPFTHTLKTYHSEPETPLAMLAGMLPFVLFGSLYVLKGVNYHTPLAWLGRGVYGIHGYLELIVLGLTLIGLGIGWARRFPRWSYAYLGVTVMSSVLLADVSTSGLRLFGYTFGREAWSWRGWLPLLALTAIMLLLTRSFRPLGQLIQNIRRDWTLLSFALYAALAQLFLVVAYDNKSWYGETLYLPLNLFLQMLVFIGGAYIYMRGQRQWLRTLALPVAFILLVPISNLVTTLADYSGSQTTDVGKIILPLVWLGWASVPLWPGVASQLWQRFRPV